jgi:hypothetical protein
MGSWGNLKAAWLVATECVARHNLAVSVLPATQITVAWRKKCGHGIEWLPTKHPLRQLNNGGA